MIIDVCIEKLVSKIESCLAFYEITMAHSSSKGKTEMSQEQIEFLKNCELEFKDRYTAKDPEFMKLKEKSFSDPPIVLKCDKCGYILKLVSDGKRVTGSEVKKPCDSKALKKPCDSRDVKQPSFFRPKFCPHHFYTQNRLDKKMKNLSMN